MNPEEIFLEIIPGVMDPTVKTNKLVKMNYLMNVRLVQGS